MRCLPRLVFFVTVLHGLPVFYPAQTPGKKPPATKSVAEIAALIRPSLVKITQSGREGIDGIGSGFVIREDGLVATNKHVIGEARNIEVETSDGAKHKVTEVFSSDVHLDLAILRVAKKGLKPLVLGDSDKIEQGDPIVAMGNPEGLAFSVVEGVVSAMRDIEDIPMIQVAVPIERGNSGGPLLDRQGRVLGVLTLKAQRTENLGFSMPVNQLKRLLEKPNPVPMERWLTIGVLDPKMWKPLLGAQWTQHAGVVRSEIMGAGFGGRTLCIWEPDKKLPSAFEASVSVKLEEESGAAGLMFCSDGLDKHYGFYPTAGKVRLTRFDGASVFSWTVLQELATDAYRPGDWNQLRVRVDAGKIQCFVNGRSVIEVEDTGLRGGHAGLCRFRAPAAEFKSFRIGSDLAEKPIAPEQARRIRETLDLYLTDNETRKKAIEKLLTDPAAVKRLVAEQRRTFEQNAIALRKLEQDIHRRSVTRDLVKELGKPERNIDVVRCALLVSKHDNPEIDIEQYRRSFSNMVDELRSDPDIILDTQSAVRRLSKYLFEENGFHGSRHDRNSKSNSYFNEVLEDREGLPITLSIVFVELAARLGVKDVFGVPVPGHFMVGYRPKAGMPTRLLDVFEGGKEYMPDEPLPDELVSPANARDIIMHVVRSLHGTLHDDSADFVEEHTASCLPYLDLILAIDPDAGGERISRARVREISGDREGAREDIGWLIEHPPENLPEEALMGLQRLYESLGG